jgi:hypothetical protein
VESAAIQRSHEHGDNSRMAISELNSRVIWISVSPVMHQIVSVPLRFRSPVLLLCWKPQYIRARVSIDILSKSEGLLRYIGDHGLTHVDIYLLLSSHILRRLHLC